MAVEGQDVNEDLFGGCGRVLRIHPTNDLQLVDLFGHEHQVYHEFGEAEQDLLLRILFRGLMRLARCLYRSLNPRESLLVQLLRVELLKLLRQCLLSHFKQFVLSYLPFFILLEHKLILDLHCLLFLQVSLFQSRALKRGLS